VQPDDSQLQTPVAPDDAHLWAVAHDSPDAREALFARHLPYARSISAKLYALRHGDEIEFGDYFQNACVGLLEAIDRYQPGGPASFRTYATYRIEGSILNGIEKLTEKHEQLSLKRRLQKERIAALKENIKPRASLEDSLAQVCEVAVGLAIGFMLEDTGMYQHADDHDSYPSAYQTAAWRQSKRQLLAVLDQLPERERKIVSYHYLQGLSLEQIGSILGLTKGRISQVLRQALSQMRSQLNCAEHVRVTR
jgi:RNA polymerase sigma factor for flagellar operon FliA